MSEAFILKAYFLGLKDKDNTRELWAEYFLRKQLIAEGLNNIDHINKLIATRYADIKGLKHPIPGKLLRELLLIKG